MSEKSGMNEVNKVNETNEINETNELHKKLAGKEIHVIPHAHSDYAWTHHRQWHIERYVLIINEVLDIMNENPDFTWMMDNENHMLAPFMKYCPHRIGEFKQRIAEGRLEITNGTIALVRSTQIGDETFIRNITFGKKFFHKMIPDLGIEVYNNVDVSIGHSQLPQLLRLGGYNYLWGWRPQGALDNKGIPRQFVWKGLDDTDLICARGFYGGLCGISYMDRDLERDWKDVSRTFYQKEIETINDHSETRYLMVLHGMDDSRPLKDFTDKPSRIPDFMKTWNRKENSSIAFSTVMRYFKKISDQSLPVVEGVLDGCDTGLNAPTKGQNGLWRMRLELDRLLVKAETLWSFASLSGEKYPEEKINELWMLLLGISGHAQEFCLDTDFEELYSSALSVKYQAEELIRQAKYRMVMRIAQSGRKQYVVFNTLNWARRGIVPIHIVQPAGGRKFKLSDPDGNNIPYQICSTFKGDVPYQGAQFDEMDILAEAILPAMGYTSLYITEDPVSAGLENFGIDENDVDLKIKGAGCQIIDTGKIKVRFREGRIAEIADRSGKAVYEAHSGDPVPGDIKFTKVRHHRKAAWLYSNHYQGADLFRPVCWKWEDFGPLKWRYVVDGTVGANKARQEIILLKDSDCIDFCIEIDCFESSTGFFSAVFPIDKGSKLSTDIPFGIEERDIANEPYGKQTDNVVDNIERLWEGVFTAKSWVNYNYQGTSNSLITENCGHYFLLDKEEDTVSIILTRVIDYEKSEDWVRHSHSFIDCRGRHHFSYSLCLQDAAVDLLQVVRLAKEKASMPEVEPLIGGTEAERSLPAKASILDIQSDSAIISAFFREGNHYYLRLYEVKGVCSKLQVKFAKKIVSLMPVDFQGDPVERAPIYRSSDGCAFETELRPWEILTIQISLVL